ncbi:hypothetical protein HY479_00880 [Candidatus Uhrbacteria bacterium]|nr:hypothetical protein [Candidatus Uhrbacteria bacterium]
MKRTHAFHATWGHAPTRTELLSTLETDGASITKEGAWRALQESADEKRTRHEDEMFTPRKLRTARRVAGWLARCSSVRFVALCNTTALGHARNEADLDFFAIIRTGTIMATRGLATLPFKLARRRPGEGERDAVCLSYFVTDDGLDLSSHMLTPDDPYFRYWFLSLLPLYDDGISAEFWAVNTAITSRHAFATRWIPPPDFRVQTPRLRIPVPRWLEPVARGIQTRAFPAAIRNLMNRDTRVIVTDKALKFHVDDRREEYRRRYEDECRIRGIRV